MINKFDINTEVAEEIELYLQEQQIPLLAKVPFDKSVVAAMTAGQTIVEYAPEGIIAQQIADVWQAIR